MGVFDGMNSAEVYGKGKYFKPGVYVCKVTRVQLITTRKKDDAFIVDFEIQAAAPGDSGEPSAVGTSAAWFQSFEYKESALGKIKEFLAAVLQVDPSTAPPGMTYEELATAAVGEDNPLAGALVCVETFMTKTKSGNDFTQHRFSAHTG